MHFKLRKATRHALSAPYTNIDYAVSVTSCFQHDTHYQRHRQTSTTQSPLRPAFNTTRTISATDKHPLRSLRYVLLSTRHALSAPQTNIHYAVSVTSCFQHDTHYQRHRQTSTTQSPLRSAFISCGRITNNSTRNFSCSNKSVLSSCIRLVQVRRDRLMSSVFWVVTQRKMVDTTFRDYLSVPSSRVKLSENVFPKRLYQTYLRRVTTQKTEECFNRSGSLRSRKEAVSKSRFLIWTSLFRYR